MKSNATPILDALKGKYLFIDNDLQTGIQRLGLFGILSRQGVAKRSGEKIPQLIFAILVWPFLGADSISSFCGKMIGNFYAKKVSVWNGTSLRGFVMKNSSVF